MKEVDMPTLVNRLIKKKVSENERCEPCGDDGHGESIELHPEEIFIEVQK